MNTPAYKPRADSLPSQCIGFFTNNPHEELTLDDITEKFDATRCNIHSVLRPAMDAGLLCRARNDDGDYIYLAGAELGKPSALVTAHKPPHAVPAAAPPMPKTTKPVLGVRHHIDLSSLKVDEGIACMQSNATLGKKWDPLFDKLANPGQSIELPGNMQGAVAAAAQARNKENRGQFKCYKTGPDTSRVWRTA